MTASAIYEGAVVHSRLRPVRHRLRYRMLNLLLDLDEMPGLSDRLRLFGHNRRALFSFHDRDHGDGSAVPLARQIDGWLAGAGLQTGGRILALCMPRVLGMVFNPITVYFCHRADGTLQAMLYEVNNTFGQRHSYLLPVTDQGPDIRQRCDKRFYVSPFMDMDQSYAFRLTRPGETVALGVEARDAGGPLLFAAFSGRRRDLSDAALLRSFLAHPLLALRVLAGIHWEALKLWRKGMRLRPRPAAPADPVSIGQEGSKA
ncbi:DUF1365 domain-containing protein [Rhodovarius crocodyli]|uniref:DUF1365 domain-containing protein n=1 Tax=Rhodovarius crocodyli TaxID=1979269 RepID=A0A437M3G4_9PROT|nr:DUF1365 family protein [Rhodovarius crocodyli]RVT92004.1 DUF1365 domain-containing protein [Rhodovarius crocodyli]